jgi:hypothetical protein
VPVPVLEPVVLEVVWAAERRASACPVDLAVGVSEARVHVQAQAPDWAEEALCREAPGSAELPEPPVSAVLPELPVSAEPPEPLVSAEPGPVEPVRTAEPVGPNLTVS